jgi:hypothetical protein
MPVVPAIPARMSTRVKQYYADILASRPGEARLVGVTK